MSEAIFRKFNKSNPINFYLSLITSIFIAEVCIARIMHDKSIAGNIIDHLETNLNPIN